MTFPGFKSCRSLIDVNERAVTALVNSFTCGVEKSANKDEFGNEVDQSQMSRPAGGRDGRGDEGCSAPAHPTGGRFIVDLGDVSYLDISGLGTLVGLKSSAIRQGFCIFEFANPAPRILELLSITNLTKLFSCEVGA